MPRILAVRAKVDFVIACASTIELGTHERVVYEPYSRIILWYVFRRIYRVDDRIHAT